MTKHDGTELDRDPATSTLKNDFLDGHVLNTKELSVKFDKNIIIPNKFMNIKKILANGGNMKDVFKIKGMHRTS
jgi:hypothetical protein